MRRQKLKYIALCVCVAHWASVVDVPCVNACMVCVSVSGGHLRYWYSSVV